MAKALLIARSGMQNVSNINYVPEGDNPITDTIATGLVYGGVYMGGGSGAQKGLTHPQRGVQSCYIWDGSVNGYALPLFHLGGSNFSLRDFNLQGRATTGDTTTQTPAVGILIEKPAIGIGTGKTLFENLYIEDCDVAIKATEGPVSDNSDNCTFSRITSRDCPTFYRQEFIQNHAMNFYDCIARNAAIFFDIAGGGKQSFNSCGTFGAVSTIFLNISGTSSTMDKKVALFKVRNVVFDSQKPTTSKLLAMNKTPGVNLQCTIVFDMFTIGNSSYQADEIQFQVSGGSAVTLSNGYGVGEKTLAWWDEANSSWIGHPRYLIDSCRFHDTYGTDGDGPSITDPTQIFSTVAANSYGACLAEVVNCLDDWGRPIPNFRGLVNAEDANADPAYPAGAILSVDYADNSRLNDVGDPVNLFWKQPGKGVYNTDTNKTVFPISSAASGNWYTSEGVLEHSPV